MTMPNWFNIDTDSLIVQQNSSMEIHRQAGPLKANGILSAPDPYCPAHHLPAAPESSNLIEVSDADGILQVANDPDKDSSVKSLSDASPYACSPKTDKLPSEPLNPE